MIPINRSQYNIKKLESFYQNYQNLKKNLEGKKTPIHVRKIKNFERKLDTLFDISKSSELESLPNETQLFLLKSREKGRYRCTPLVTEETSNVNQGPTEQHKKKTEENYNDNMIAVQ